MLDFLISLVWFYLVLIFLVPLLCITFVVSQVGYSVWLSCLSLIYPEVEFIKTSSVRSILDTHRNQGITSVLLCIRGQAQSEAVRRHLQEVVQRRTKTGHLSFPRLHQGLVTRCGNYGWQKVNFDLDYNLSVASATFKGRAITDYNIQEYVSDIISKYLPQSVPPWQVIVIPTTEDHHYILVKLHHLLISEGLNIGDLLPLVPPTKQNTGYFESKSPLVGVFKKPEAIPYLKERLGEEISNRWNEFVSNYDPLERIELLKRTPRLSEFLGIIVVTLVSICKECRRGFSVIKDDIFSKIKFVSYTIKRELHKRQVTFYIFLCSILETLNPKNLLTLLVKNIWVIFISCTIRFPTFLYSEIVAFYTCLTLHYCVYPNTYVGLIYSYVPLFFNAFKELLYCANVLFHAPKNILNEVLIWEKSLQTVTLCGRKSVAWSDPVKIDYIKLISKKTGLSETEVLLSTVSSCLSKYLSQTGQPIPNVLPTCLRNINSSYVFATGTNVKPEDATSGLVCLNLPMIGDQQKTTLLENLLQIQSKLRSSLEKQAFSHMVTVIQTKVGILTKLLPATILSVYLKYLSRKYAVYVAELNNRYPNIRQRTLWGQEVTSAIYWSPPQANTCISLCLNEYADHIKLGVMCDSQLVPHHSVLARQFPRHIERIGRIIGVI